MKPVLVVLVVGLTPALIGTRTPHIAALVARGGMRSLVPVVPAVTCTMQSTLLTGTMPRMHGAVANGWYHRDIAEVALWRQSNHLVEGEMIWDTGRTRDPSFTCAQMFWWYNMYGTADWSATPRPMYPADGRKIPDHYTHPPELHDELDAKLGTFPLFRFWGPATDISASQWITEATLHLMATRDPTLSLSYIPHLDYDLQRFGPDPAHPAVAKALAEVDVECGRLIDAAAASGRDVVLVSEYGITPVIEAVHLNRALRAGGWLQVRAERGRDILDAGASRAFAVADHQLAHVYVHDPRDIGAVRDLIAGIDGVEQVLDRAGQRAIGLDHDRSGELVALSVADRWFSYYYWLDDARAPDFARTVDIHRKPGYDPVELFVDPAIGWKTGAIGWRLAKRKLGLRSLLDVISASDTALVRGSHGRMPDDPAHGPLMISSRPDLMPDGAVLATDFKRLVLDHVFA